MGPFSRRGSAALLALLLAIAALAACHRTPERTRLLVVGIDGGDMDVLERLWSEGRLPNLKGLAERGVATRLATAYGKSPVIWTTMATGVAPAQHGIRDFVVPTAQGDLPVSSSLRRVPALWNMLSSVGLKVGVVSWWASWPAEAIEGGVVLSDRVIHRDRLAEGAGRISPAELEDRLSGWLERALAADVPSFERVEVGARDRLSVTVGRWMLEERDFDLAMVYLRSVDVRSHLHWKEFEPESFGGSRVTQSGDDPVTAAYVATDEAIGLLMQSAGPEWDVLVVSDHGFVAMDREEVRVQLDLERVLAELGLLRRDTGGAVDLEASSVYPYSARPGQELKTVRWGGAAGPDARGALEEALARVTWDDGAPAFRVRSPRGHERRLEADAVVVVLRPEGDERLLLDREPLENAGLAITRQSGTHRRATAGILLAAGPHVDPAADLEGVSIHDFAPTVLAAFGLPVAEDFAGVARRALFTAALRERHPARSIPTWGSREASDAPEASSVDEEILEDLRALGYLDP